MIEAETEAEAIALKGEAEAYAIECRAKAESEQMAKKADAYKEYGKAAKIDIWMESLPKMAAEVAAPMSQCERITMVMDLDSKTGGATKHENTVFLDKKQMFLIVCKNKSLWRPSLSLSL